MLKKYFKKLIPKQSDQRERLARRYVKGCGLEIGALHCPLILPAGVSVKYVDWVSREESIKKFPELDTSEIVTVDYLDDGFLLFEIPQASQDFLIANHVLEHTPNPIQVLKNWTRVLKPGGILFISVPIAEECFDKGRSQTTIEHLIDDFELYNKSVLPQAQTRIEQKNKEHLREWINISERNIFSDRYADYKHPSFEEIEKRIEAADMKNIEIHFHTFSLLSYKSLLSFFTASIDKTVQKEKVIQNGGEIISVMRKFSKN
ncbi:methyltransferase domain-containing protein [Desulfococcaceae bacterium HSG9]|nr:methyltransferase domain-containing protein [Desulfococcaceae bacterium HSG9]